MDEETYNDWLSWVDYLQEVDEERERLLGLKHSRRKKKLDDDE